MVQSALEGTHSAYAFLCPSFSALLYVTNSYNRSVGLSASLFFRVPLGLVTIFLFFSKLLRVLKWKSCAPTPLLGLASVAVDSSCWPSLAPAASTKTLTTLNPSFKIRHYSYYGFTQQWLCFYHVLTVRFLATDLNIETSTSNHCRPSRTRRNSPVLIL
jgi:hypothetical protein